MTDRYLAEVGEELKKFQEGPDKLKIEMLRMLDKGLVDTMRYLVEDWGLDPEDAYAITDHYYRKEVIKEIPGAPKVTMLPTNPPSKRGILERFEENLGHHMRSRYYISTHDDKGNSIEVPAIPSIEDEYPTVSNLALVLSPYLEEEKDGAISSLAWDAFRGEVSESAVKRVLEAAKKTKHPFVTNYMTARDNRSVVTEDSVREFLKSLGKTRVLAKSQGFYATDKRLIPVHSQLTGTRMEEIDFSDDIFGSVSWVEKGLLAALETLDAPRQLVEASGVPNWLHKHRVFGDLLYPGSTTREWLMDPGLWAFPQIATGVLESRVGRGITRKLRTEVAAASTSKKISESQVTAILGVYRKLRKSEKYAGSPAATSAMEAAGVGPRALGEDVALGTRLAAEREAAEEALRGLEKTEKATVALEKARREAAALMEDLDVRDLNNNLQSATSKIVEESPASWWDELLDTERDAVVSYGNQELYDILTEGQKRHFRTASYGRINRATRDVISEVWLKAKNKEDIKFAERPKPKPFGKPRKASTILARRVGKKAELEGTELALEAPPPGIPTGVTDVSEGALKKDIKGVRPYNRPVLQDYMEDLWGERKRLEDLTVGEAHALVTRLKEAAIGAAFGSNVPETSILDDLIIELADGTTDLYLGATPLDWVRDTGKVVSTKLGKEGRVIVRTVDRVNNQYLRAGEAYHKDLDTILKGVEHGSSESAYIASVLDNHPLAEELALQFSPEQLARLDITAQRMRGMFDRVIEHANATRAVVRRRYKVSKKALPDIPRRENYLTHLMQDPVLVPLHKTGHVGDFAREVFNRFFLPRTGNKAHKLDIIDVANVYFPVSLRSIYWTPVRAKWKHLQKNIPRVGPGGGKVQQMVEAANDWLKYISGESSAIGKLSESIIENPAALVARTFGVSREGSRLFGIKVRRASQSATYGLTNVVYFNTLGGNISAALANATQTFNALVGYGPIDFIPAVVINMSNSKLVDKLMKMVGVRGSGILFNRENYLKMLSGVGAEQGGYFKQLRAGYSELGKKGMDLALAPFSWMESMNRKITVTTSMLNANRKGIPLHKAVARARRDLARMQFDFTPVGQLPLLRSFAGRGMLQYARFPLQQTDFYMSELFKAGVNTADGVRAGNVLRTLEPISRWGVYTGSAFGVSALGATLGIDVSRAFPEPIIELGRSLAAFAGFEESEFVPSGQGVWDYLPAVGPLPSVLMDIFGDKTIRSGVTDLPKPLEGILVPRPIRTVLTAEKSRKQGDVRDSLEQFVENFETGADLSSMWSAFWSSPTYRRLALGFPSADVKVRYQVGAEAQEGGREYNKKKTEFLDKIVSALRKGRFVEAQNIMKESFAFTVEGPKGVETPLWGQRKTSLGGSNISPLKEFTDKLHAQLSKAGYTQEHRIMKSLPVMVRQAWAARLAEGIKQATEGE